MRTVSPFHLAIPVWNLEACRVFYRDTLGCEEGRSSDHWVDFNFFGHQLVIHFKPKETDNDLHLNKVDGKQVPVPHFGVILPWEHFETFAGADLVQIYTGFIYEGPRLIVKWRL